MRYRPMAPADIRECVDLVSNNPVIGPRYGHLIERLPEVWLSLLECDLSTACVFYGDEGSHAPICFFGITAAVEDGFLCEMKTPPHFWIGPELTRRFIAGKSPVVTGKDFRRANSHGGLNLVCLENCVREGHKADSELQRRIMLTFFFLHRGYLFRKMIVYQQE